MAAKTVALLFVPDWAGGRMVGGSGLEPLYSLGQWI